MLSGQESFTFIDNSSPKNKKLYFGYDSTKSEIKNSLKKKILDSDVIIAIFSKGFLKHKWIKYEINIAKRYKKYILFTDPFIEDFKHFKKFKYFNNVEWESKKIIEAISLSGR